MWLSRYPATSALAYSIRVYSTVGEYLDAALDGILSEALRVAEGKGGGIDPMTTKVGGQGERR